jgi:hypothetical protein
MKFALSRLLPLFFFALAFSACRRPAEPALNLLEVSFHDFQPAYWDKAPEKISFNLEVGTAGDVRSPLITIEKNKDGKYVTSSPAWRINYLDLEKAGLHAPLRILSTDLNAAVLKIIQGELAAKTLDFDTIPFKAPVLLVIQDNPNPPTRTFEQATGAKLVLKIQRKLLEGARDDLPVTGTMPWFAESWWTHNAKPVSYEQYREFYILSQSIVNEVYGAGSFKKHDIAKDRTMGEMKLIRSAIEAYVFQKLRQQKKERILTALRADRHTYEPKKAELFWDYLAEDMSMTELAVRHAAKSATAMMQSLIKTTGDSRPGLWMMGMLEKEIAQDSKELEIYLERAKAAVRESDPAKSKVNPF